ncbi:MAG: hypothetical protein EXR65_01015 [Dehalococcoidia bacterium]|nr:hypothetical protein [Dehalococcoidia bacterium]
MAASDGASPPPRSRTERPPMPATPALHSRRDVLRLGAGLAGVALLSAACRDGSPAAPELQLRESSASGAPPRGGVLRIAAPGGDTQHTASPRARDVLRRALTYSQLVALDPRSALLYGDLASKLELPDPLTVRFTLRRELRFHPDGGGLAAALTAADVRADLEARAAAGEYLPTQVIARVETPDQQTVVLRLRGPFSLLFEFLADPASGAVRAKVRSPRDGEPLGSGPFVPAGQPGQPGGAPFARNELYHRRELPRLDGVVVRDVDDERAAADAFARAEVDLHVHAPGAVVQSGERAAATLRRGGFALIGLGLSLLPEKGGRAVRSVTAFQDRRVRRAVSVALDRGRLAALAAGAVTGPVGPAHAADALPAEELAAHPLYRQQPAEARALLGAAGHSGLALRLQAPNQSELAALAREVERQLNDAGFAAALQLVDAREWERNFRAGDFEATVFRVEGLRTPDLGLREHTAAGLEGGFSPWGYSNPVYDAAVRAALSELDPTRRAQRSREAQRTLLEDVPAMFPLAVPWQQASTVPSLRAYEFDGYGFNDGWLAARWGLSPSGG